MGTPRKTSRRPKGTAKPAGTSAAVTSKGQVTVPAEIRDYLGVCVDGRSAVQVALSWYRDKGVDFGDALLHAQCCDGGGIVLTFNEKHFRRLGTAWKQP